MNYTAVNITQSVAVALTFIAAFTGIFFAWYFYLKAKQKERLALIEKASEGIDFAKLFEKPKRQYSFPWLKLGILLFSITLGVSVGIIFANTTSMDEDYTPLFGFMFGGLGMIAAHFAGKKEDRQTN